MAISPPPLQTKSLRRCTNLDEFKLYRSALEWDLSEPIVIENREDLRSEQQWHDRVEPYHHQVTNLITFCRRLPVTLLADDVGLGKTISAGLVVSELISRGRVSKILIVCPKLLIPQWREELDIKFGIGATEAVGKEIIKAKPPEEVGAVITTYASARLHFNAIAKAGYDMLILDEAHKLRNLYGVENPPQVATRFRQALADRLFKYVLMLTATPIQNRLWDLYSLVDLLTVARGHENPFGSEGMFARNFIADKRTEARKLRPEKRDEFRSIVYGYMSRVRRADANLHFPDRKVQLHKVDPTPEEIELIDLIAEPIQKLNRLAQISILQALISSPHALAAQLENMANRGTVPTSLATEVRAVVNRIQTTAKLQGLGALVDELKTEQSEQWRMVVFTTRRETQTTIEAFLTERGISCGLINGDSSARNQKTITRFKKDPPEIHVIISTEAGSEGVNLQAANVLVNYDLPWNPMIVEQRIGRIQRLASVHASVCIFNVILQGTFEEYIVGRLMEKLQMASHAIGDVEALLEAAGLDDGEDDEGGFAEKIRELVVASLAGKNVKEATRLAEESIATAKIEIEREEKNINTMLGGSDGAIDLGPRCPKLPPHIRSMDVRSFASAALQSLGGSLSPQATAGLYRVDLDGRQELIRFEDADGPAENSATLCRPGSAFFERLVTRITNVGLHQVEDIDRNPLAQAEEIGKNWVNSFGGIFNTSSVQDAWRCFTGTAILRVRITVAHDSYERLVEVSCSPEEQQPHITRDALEPMGKSLDNPLLLGLPVGLLTAKAMEDIAVAEFCRFYQERLEDEIRATGDDIRKKKKLEDDFTPRIEIALVGLEGTIHRRMHLCASYKIGNKDTYESLLTVIPSEARLLNQPEMEKCDVTGTTVPRDCLSKCQISGKIVLQYMLQRSETSGRMALPEHVIVCALSGKHVLSDEIEKSAVTGRPIAISLLKTSALSGKRAEPEFFTRCEFTLSEILQTESAASQASGKRYRIDEQTCSYTSGKMGHKSEFVFCAQTNRPLLPTETERCEITGRVVMLGLLEKCEITRKKVLPSELERCTVTGKKALKKLLVTSSVSSARTLEQEAVRSAAGKFCTPLEAKTCMWSGSRYHPDDVYVCQLVGVTVHFQYAMRNEKTYFEPLVHLLDGTARKADKSEIWGNVETVCASAPIGSKSCKVESAELSPDGKHLAVCLETKSWMGLKVRHAGLLFSVADQNIVGRITLGKREPKGWRPTT